MDSITVFSPMQGFFALATVPLLAYTLSLVSFLSLPNTLQPARWKSHSLFGRLWAYLKAWSSGHSGLMNGYSTNSKQNRAFVMPSPSGSPIIMLPKEQQKWLVSQPDRVLSQRIANVESYALNHLFPSVDMHNEVMINMVKRYMVGRLGAAQPAMHDELKGLMDARLGTDGTWRDISIATTFKDIVLRTGYRVHVGDSLCGNEAFVEASWRMTLWAGIGTMIVGQFAPRILKRPIGYLCSLPITYYTSKYRSLIYPVFKERLEQVERVKNGEASDEDLPRDAITWTAQILQERSSEGATIDNIIDNFITIFTAAFATIPVMVHAVINLVSLPEAQAYLPLLQEEIRSTFSRPEAWAAADTTAPGHMPLLEAFLRESMRYTPFFARGQEHKVVSKAGLSLPDGTHVPYGTYLACPVAGVAGDERFYENASKFDPYRFLVEVEDEKMGEKTWLLKPNCQLTSPSEIFMGFGYGKHACPGRFFAARIAKLIISYFVYYYDFEPLERRPSNRVVGSFTIPPLLSSVRVRRKEAYVKA